MAHRVRNRFALVDGLVVSPKPEAVSQGIIINSLKSVLADNWGQIGLSDCLLRIAGFEIVSSDKKCVRFVFILKFPRDLQTQVVSSLSTCCWLCTELPAAFRVLEICGRMRNAAHAGICFFQKLSHFQKLNCSATEEAQDRYRLLPDYC